MGQHEILDIICTTSYKLLCLNILFQYEILSLKLPTKIFQNGITQKFQLFIVLESCGLIHTPRSRSYSFYQTFYSLRHSWSRGADVSRRTKTTVRESISNVVLGDHERRSCDRGMSEGSMKELRITKLITQSYLESFERVMEENVVRKNKQQKRIL